MRIEKSKRREGSQRKKTKRAITETKEEEEAKEEVAITKTKEEKEAKEKAAV